MKTLKIAFGVALALVSMTVVFAQSTETIALQGNQLFPEGKDTFRE